MARMKNKSGVNGPHGLRLRNLVSALHRVLLAIRLDDLPSRVRELPDERTVRFYTTVGLLAPPLRFAGRRAIYGHKHLTQLLAIKRLQSKGLSIRDIHERLRDKSLSELTAIAAVDSKILANALQSAARDPALDLWPRPATDRPAKVVATGSQDLRAYRITNGVYVHIDPAICKLSEHQIRQRILSFAENNLNA